MVNGIEPTAEARRADPGRIDSRVRQRGGGDEPGPRDHRRAALADLHHLHEWNMDFVRQSSAGERYERVAGEIDRSLQFMSACGPSTTVPCGPSDLFASHEMLVLDYERALLRPRGPHGCT